jgi:redox-sensitive bicupin YhaK (pirin superfamily)
MNREVQRIVNARLQRSATGIVGRRPFPSPALDPPSPFSVLEELGPTDGEPGDAESGSQDRQRGVHVVTSLFAGELQYAFATGERGLLEPGDVLWALPARENTYSEVVSGDRGRDPRRVHGVRFTVDLPADLAGSDRRCIKISAARIPWLAVGGQAARTRVLAGEAFGTRALVQAGSGVQAQDWLLDSDADVTIPLPDHLGAMIYVCSETAWVGDQGSGVRPGQLAILAPGQAVRLRRAANTLLPVRLLLLAGPRQLSPDGKDTGSVMSTWSSRIAGRAGEES